MINLTQFSEGNDAVNTSKMSQLLVKSKNVEKHQNYSGFFSKQAKKKNS